MALAQVKQLEGNNAQLEAKLKETRPADVVLSLERQVCCASMHIHSAHFAPLHARAVQGREG